MLLQNPLLSNWNWCLSQEQVWICVFAEVGVNRKRCGLFVCVFECTSVLKIYCFLNALSPHSCVKWRQKSFPKKLHGSLAEMLFLVFQFCFSLGSFCWVSCWSLPLDQRQQQTLGGLGDVRAKSLRLSQPLALPGCVSFSASPPTPCCAAVVRC